MLKQSPDDLRLYTVLGSVELLAKNPTVARDHLQTALGLKADYIPALLSLSRLNLVDGNLTEASKQFDRILQTDKEAVAAMMGHAQIAEQQDKHEKALSWVEQARAATAKALTPRLVLARYYLKTCNATAALKVAEEIHNNNPNARIASEAGYRSGSSLCCKRSNNSNIILYGGNQKRTLLRISE